MIKKQTVVDQIEITRDGTMQVRFGLLLVEDGVVINCQWHRTSIEPGGDVGAQIATVSNHLGQAELAPGIAGKYPAVSLVDSERVRAHALVAWTPEVVTAYKAKVSAMDTSK